MLWGRQLRRRGVNFRYLRARQYEEIKRLTGTSAPIEFRPLPEDDPKIRRPDITKARQLLGWEPKVPLEEGLRRTIEYFRGVV